MINPIDISVDSQQPRLHENVVPPFDPLKSQPRAALQEIVFFVLRLMDVPATFRVSGGITVSKILAGRDEVSAVKLS